MIKGVNEEKGKLEVERDHLIKVEEEKKRGGRDAEEEEAVVDAIGKMDL